MAMDDETNIKNRERIWSKLHEEWINAAYKDRQAIIPTPASSQLTGKWLDVFVVALTEITDEKLELLARALTCCDEGKDVLELLAGDHAWKHLDALLD